MKDTPTRKPNNAPEHGSYSEPSPAPSPSVEFSSAELDVFVPTGADQAKLDALDAALADLDFDLGEPAVSAEAEGEPEGITPEDEAAIEAAAAVQEAVEASASPASMLPESFAPGCYGMGLIFKAGSPECSACPFVERCQPIATGNLTRLRKELEVRVAPEETAVSPALIQARQWKAKWESPTHAPAPGSAAARADEIIKAERLTGSGLRFHRTKIRKRINQQDRRDRKRAEKPPSRARLAARPEIAQVDVTDADLITVRIARLRTWIEAGGRSQGQIKPHAETIVRAWTEYQKVWAATGTPPTPQQLAHVLATIPELAEKFGGKGARSSAQKLIERLAKFEAPDGPWHGL